MKIEAGKLVVLGYEIYEEGGDLFESSEDDPIEFVQGDGDVLPGLESALEGRSAGEKLEVMLDPEEAFGDYNPEGLVTVPRSELPPDADLVQGEWITVIVQDDEADEDEEPGEMDMRIAEVDDDSVVLDANHPLAGKRVKFKLEVISVADPS